MLWRSSDVVDCGLLQSVMNDENIQRTLRNSWGSVIQNFNLDWKEKDEDLQAQEATSAASDGPEEDGWEPPAQESMDAVGI